MTIDKRNPTLYNITGKPNGKEDALMRVYIGGGRPVAEWLASQKSKGESLARIILAFQCVHGNRDARDMELGEIISAMSGNAGRTSPKIQEPDEKVSRETVEQVSAQKEENPGTMDKFPKIREKPETETLTTPKSHEIDRRAAELIASFG